ncbi:MAG TPA: AAA family ATPase [Candidatus Nanopelagicales bacterium]|nr:AAA family ATPase [Candidatus Nanopelagicales bacterium]
MKIPYGRSNFGEIRRQGFFYVDKTPFIAELERADLGYAYLFLLRPRRFGKSLFLSLLEHYYDIARAEEFDALFRGLWIHEHPTPERSQYLVLSLDFSTVSADGGQEPLRQAFCNTVRIAVLDLVRGFRDRIPALAEVLDELKQYDDASTLLHALMRAVRRAGHKLYVLIDEYDNFANRLLSDGSQDMYEWLVERVGFVRTFYATLKSGTTSGAVGRIFITGVSPLLLDDMSSGFNIAINASQDPGLNELAGFTRADVERALRELFAAQPELSRRREFEDRGVLLELLERYYDGYRFSPQSTGRIYNSDMVLYFLHEISRTRGLPANMLDQNVRTEYRALQRIGMLTGAAAVERRRLLEEILADGGIRSEITRQFGVSSLSSQTQFISLLYYLGMLTLGEQPSDLPRESFLYRLEIPNLVIRELQWEHLATLLKAQGGLAIDTREMDEALRVMAQEGDIEPFLGLFHERVVKAIGLKDLRRFDEKAMKLMMLAFISMSRIFHPLSEKEFAQGYCDLFLGVSPLYPAARFAWLLELKYLPTAAKAAQIEKAFAEAEGQVARYASDERLVPLLTRGQALRAGSLVFVGAKRVVFRLWEAGARNAATARKGAAKPRARKSGKRAV